MGFETNRPIDSDLGDPRSGRYFRDALERSEAEGPEGLDQSDMGYDVVAAIQLVGCAICEALDDRSAQRGYQLQYPPEEIAAAVAELRRKHQRTAPDAVDREIMRRRLGPAFGQVAGE